jgi:hypothetical protein
MGYYSLTILKMAQHMRLIFPATKKQNLKHQQ